ncbi:MAG: FAD-binding oxidoreductase, partial [bacterium]
MDVRRLTDRASISSYTGDESSSFEGTAEAVYLPRTPDEVAAVLREARAAGRSVTLSGAGTSITGSRVPHGGIVVSTERLRDAGAVPLPGADAHSAAAGHAAPPTAAAGANPAGADSADAKRPAEDWQGRGGADYTLLISSDCTRAIVPAGIRLFELDQALAGDDVFYPPDPTETTAMLGGTIATNAGGARSYRYGATRDWVEALLVIPVGGDPVWVRRGEWVARDGALPLPAGFPVPRIPVPDAIRMPKTKHAAGLYLQRNLDLVDLLVGSEGILAAVAAAEV